MTALALVALVLTALIHAVPATALFSARSIERLYGEGEVTPELVLLLRHRAAGFATLSVMAVAALVVVSWRTPVLLFALGSVATFVVLWLRSGVRTPAINRVAYADGVLIPFLIAGLVV